MGADNGVEPSAVKKKEEEGLNSDEGQCQGGGFCFSWAFKGERGVNGLEEIKAFSLKELGELRGSQVH